MRKVVLLAAVVLAAALSVKSDIAVAQMVDQNPNTTKLMRDGMNPYQATSTPAKPAKAMRKGKKSKKMSKK